MTQPHGEHASSESTRANGAISRCLQRWENGRPASPDCSRKPSYECSMRTRRRGTWCLRGSKTHLNLVKQQSRQSRKSPSASPTEHVRQVLHLVAAGDDQFEDHLSTGESSNEERRIVVALLVHCLAKDPFGWISSLPSPLSGLIR
jgi:hypothetical protein